MMSKKEDREGRRRIRRRIRRKRRRKGRLRKMQGQRRHSERSRGGGKWCEGDEIMEAFEAL